MLLMGANITLLETQQNKHKAKAAVLIMHRNFAAAYACT